MVERQPGRPTDYEVDRAVLRLLEDDYWTHPKPSVDYLLGILSMIQFMPGYQLHRLGNVTNKPYYNLTLQENDRVILEQELSCEGINPTETFEQFVLRKSAEILER